MKKAAKTSGKVEQRGQAMTGRIVRLAQGQGHGYIRTDGGLEVSTGRDADAAAIASSERGRVDRAMAALPIEFREVLVLRELEDLSYREISDVVGVPIGTVMSRLARARKRLAELLVSAREAS